MGTPNFSAIHPRHNHIYIAACDTFARYRGRTPPRFPHTSRRCSRAYVNHRMTILPLTSPILQPVPLPPPSDPMATTARRRRGSAKSYLGLHPFSHHSILPGSERSHLLPSYSSDDKSLEVGSKAKFQLAAARAACLIVFV